eukprot:16445778-Heterocapsa_arctica.AAC.1
MTNLPCETLNSTDRRHDDLLDAPIQGTTTPGCQAQRGPSGDDDVEGSSPPPSGCRAPRRVDHPHGKAPCRCSARKRPR